MSALPDLHRSQYRLPVTLHEQLQVAAAAAGRSVNAEIVARLSASFDTEAQDAHLQGLIQTAVAKALVQVGLA